MTALEQAARQALVTLEIAEGAFAFGHIGFVKMIKSSITDLRQALEEPKQEPVAWCRSDTVADWKGQILNIAYMFPFPKGLKNPIPLYTEPSHPPLNQFNPDWDTIAVMVEEQQRMAKRIEELEERCEDLAADKGTYFRLYEALCIKAESDKKANK